MHQDLTCSLCNVWSSNHTSLSESFNKIYMSVACNYVLVLILYIKLHKMVIFITILYNHRHSIIFFGVFKMKAFFVFVSIIQSMVTLHGNSIMLYFTSVNKHSFQGCERCLLGFYFNVGNDVHNLNHLCVRSVENTCI